ncbi:ATP12 family chaperone protein [Pseudooceanicola sp. LIPI14-2-Ac024]|uniref:ATP12 family chaperone protein n=1 Tax=Pseudooceanicola sp. LIPI14-2-Ac024 TaxID=3344875 RepID=UPI0035D0EAF6
MSDWKAKRFWKEVTVDETPDGFAVLLDARPVRTPAKAPMHLPTRALAQAVADEWQAQEAEIDPRTMPATRAANAAIDKVAVQFDEVAELLSAYGDSDLLCYRADAPQELAERQAAAWDPLLDWAAETFGARLEPRQGIMHAAQDAAALARLGAEVRKLSNFELTAFHDLVGLSGSLVLGLAALHDHLPAEELWELSRIDERWQEEQWGHDEEAAEIAEIKRGSFLAAKRFHDLTRP